MLDVEQNEVYPSGGLYSGEHEDAHAHASSRRGLAARANTLSNLPSFHDLLESLDPTEPTLLQSEENDISRSHSSSSSPMQLMFTPVSNSTMACAMEGLDVERLASEVEHVMDTRTW